MKNIFFSILLVSAGLIAGFFLDKIQNKNQETELESIAGHQHSSQYVCPMHSEILSHEQGVCPICGMDLVLVKKDSEMATDASDYPEVRIKSTVINNLGVRVAQVKRKTLVRKIETPGFIQQVRKEKYSRYIAPAKGVVSKFYFTTGEWLEKGEPLIDIKLDDLVLVQQKHLELLALEKQNNSVTESEIINKEPNEDEEVSLSENTKLTAQGTHNLMKAAGMTDEMIAELEKTGKTSPTITLFASHEGEVKELRVSVGDQVKPKGMMFVLGGLMRVSVLANAFQRDASWVKAGQDVDIVLPHDDGTVYKGKVTSGAVSINVTSQNIGINLTFAAPHSIVKNGMYVVGHIYGQVENDALTLPRDAVIYSRDEKRVVVALGDGRFRPVLVKTGISNDTEIEITQGLEEGDSIVVSAQFLIDSESSLQASYRRLQPVE
ncbi:MAG: efflux RND transporter periplasmic adaptor subunit [Gammaproteobacteria bacterium]